MPRVAVIGLGTMGAGIAAVMARSGWQVRTTDIRQGAIEKAQTDLPLIDRVLDQLAMPSKGSTDSIEFVASLENAVQQADLVLENIPEDLDLKQDLFRALEPLVSETCMLASDTSGIPITQLQTVLEKPGRMVGMHWSNPPHIIPMIEVIPGEKTDAQTTQWMVETIKAMKLLPVVVEKDVPGFVENRILYAIMREAIDLVEQGVVSPEALDTCVSWGIGYKLGVVGPMALLDLAGLDIYQSVSSYLNSQLSDRSDVSPFITERTSEGRLGIKTGAGIFSYNKDELGGLVQARAKRFIAARRALEGTDGEIESKK
ncbi:MAG: 3-hydroxyacyl-CoA dehydrogenase NAD-binding domain-containing protein [Pseudomonadota bacterium]